MISKNRFLTAILILGYLSVFAQTEKPWLDLSKRNKERATALVAEMTLDEKISQMVDQSAPIPRLGIPEYNWWNEALHGVARNGRSTVFPQAISFGASFDEDLIERVATAISDEARAKFNASLAIGNRRRYAGITFWSPNVNIFRDPRWGKRPRDLWRRSVFNE